MEAILLTPTECFWKEWVRSKIGHQSDIHRELLRNENDEGQEKTGEKWRRRLKPSLVPCLWRGGDTCSVFESFNYHSVLVPIVSDVMCGPATATGARSEKETTNNLQNLSLIHI